MGLPEGPAAKATEREPSAGVIVEMVGAPGTPKGVTWLDGSDDAPLPTALTAVTRKMYAVPSVRPVTVAEVAVETPSEKSIQVVGSDASAYWMV